MPAHTPGPECKECDDNGCRVCQPHRYECCAALRDDPTQWCPLHAAAPALLEALNEIVIRAEFAGIGQSRNFDKARAAIAQAKGETA